MGISTGEGWCSLIRQAQRDLSESVACVRRRVREAAPVWMIECGSAACVLLSLSFAALRSSCEAARVQNVEHFSDDFRRIVSAPVKVLACLVTRLTLSRALLMCIFCGEGWADRVKSSTESVTSFKLHVIQKLCILVGVEIDLISRGSRMKTAYVGKLAAAVTAASVALLAPVAAMPASADTTENIPAVGQELPDEQGYWLPMNVEGSSIFKANTVLFKVTPESSDKSYESYCIEMAKPFQAGEGSIAQWDDLDRGKKAKVGWILENSYPTVDVEALASAAGVDGLTKKEAISATQAAVWHFSEKNQTDLHSDFDGNWADIDEGTAKRIVALYDYLISDANTGIDFDANSADVKLDFEGADKSFKPGDEIGPIKVESSQKTVDLNVSSTVDDSDYTIVDSNDKPIENLDKVKSGQEIYAQINDDAPAGKLTVTAESSVETLTGRIFTSSYQNAQRVVIVDSENSAEVARVQLKWEDSTTPSEEETPKPGEEETPSRGGEETPENCETPTASEEKTPTAEENTPKETPQAGGDSQQGGDSDKGERSKSNSSAEASDKSSTSALPRTGVEMAGALGAAAALIAGGTAAVFAARRKKQQ